MWLLIKVREVLSLDSKDRQAHLRNDNLFTICMGYIKDDFINLTGSLFRIKHIRHIGDYSQLCCSIYTISWFYEGNNCLDFAVSLFRGYIKILF